MLTTIIVMGMTRRLHNRSYQDVTKFLKEYRFSFFKELAGSHKRWIKHGDDGALNSIVEVNVTRGSHPVSTLKAMIRQSGIAANEWIKWSESW